MPPSERLTVSSVTRSPEATAVRMTRPRTRDTGVELPRARLIGPELVRAVLASIVSFSPSSRFWSPGATYRYREPTASNVIAKKTSARRFESDSLTTTPSPDQASVSPARVRDPCHGSDSRRRAP